MEKDIVEIMYDKQKRCMECGGTYKLEIHHRIFRSETQGGLDEFLSKAFLVYERCYKKNIKNKWGLHDIQNLVVLCKNCHQSIHSGNSYLRNKYRGSFTCPITFFNIYFTK